MGLHGLLRGLLYLSTFTSKRLLNPSFPAQMLYPLLPFPMRGTRYVHLIIFDLNTLIKYVYHANFEAPTYTNFSSILSPSSQVQILSTARSSQTTRIYVELQYFVIGQTW
jgi:hypothetical protein